MHTAELQAEVLHRVDFRRWRIHWGQPCGLQRSTLASKSGCRPSSMQGARGTNQLVLTYGRQCPDFSSMHTWSSHEHGSTPWQCKSCSGSCELMARPPCER